MFEKQDIKSLGWLLTALASGQHFPWLPLEGADALSGYPHGWRQMVWELWGGAVPSAAQQTNSLEIKQESPPTGLE